MSEIHSDLNSKGHNYEDEEDIFKSAIESPMTDSEKTIHGEHEINLNDEDEDENIVDNLSSFVASNLKATDDDSDKEEDSNRRSEGGNKNHIKPYQEQEQDAAPKPSTLSHTVEPKSNKVPFEMNSDSKAEGDTFDDQTQYIEITITEPQKQGEGMSGFIVYRVTTRTNIALFRRKEFAVFRRFSDFIGLHSKLAEKYTKKGRVVPPPPEKNMLGTTKIKIGGQNEPGTVTTQAEFIEKRRFGLERFLNRIAGHFVLKVDPDFRDFLEIDSDLPKTSSSFSGAGVVRFFNRFGETVNKISYYNKMDEADPWFEEKIQNIEALENQLKKVHVSLELLVNNRRDLALSTGTFAKSAAILSNAEEHTSLARCLAQLAEVEEKIEQIHHEQANSDFFLFAELLKDYLALIGSIKEVFYERVKTYQSWQHAQTMLNKKREIKAKLELQVKNDKIAQAREEVVEWESKVERNQEDFKSISIIIKKELEHFELTRVKEFKKIIVKYLESLLSHQQELVKYWESFLPEAKAIA